MSRAIRAGVTVLALPFILMLGIAFAAGASGAISPVSTSVGITTTCGTPPVQASSAVGGVTLDSTQVTDAQVIYDVSASIRLPQRAAIIAIATAMQESRLLNLPYGDKDSLGLFQQRPSQGWGSPAQIMQPTYAATRFYQALTQVSGWQGLPLTDAAQDVQHSGNPGAYAHWEPLATALVATFTGSASNCLSDHSTSSIPATGNAHVPAGFTLPPGTPPPVVTAIGYTFRQLGKPYIWGGTGPKGYDCSGLVMMAYQSAGISLPRTTFQQVYAGTPVYSLSQLQPGDLIFTPGSDGTMAHPGHVGMFIGSGLVIQAPQTGEKIKISPLQGYWSKNAVAMRRIALLPPLGRSPVSQSLRTVAHQPRLELVAGKPQRPAHLLPRHVIRINVERHLPADAPGDPLDGCDRPQRGQRRIGL
jgi:cell wall-associated NlpC family hydrolase